MTSREAGAPIAYQLKTIKRLLEVVCARYDRRFMKTETLNRMTKVDLYVWISEDVALSDEVVQVFRGT